MSAIGWLLRGVCVGMFVHGAVAYEGAPVPQDDGAGPVTAAHAPAVMRDRVDTTAGRAELPPGTAPSAGVPSVATPPACCCQTRVVRPVPRPPAPPPLEVRVEAVCAPPTGEARPTPLLLQQAEAELLRAHADHVRAQAEALRRSMQDGGSRDHPPPQPPADDKLAGVARLVAPSLFALALIAGAGSMAGTGMASAPTLRHWGGFGGEARANWLGRPAAFGLLAAALFLCSAVLAWAVWPPMAVATAAR